MNRDKKRYYTTFNDDFEHTKNQNFVLPQNYKWVRKDIPAGLLSAISYGLAIAFSSIYCRLCLHMRIKGAEKFKSVKGGFFIYGNHTQPIGDVFIPAICALPKRIYAVASTANYGIPIIGKILQFLGALPIVDSLSGIKALNSAIEYRINKGNPIVIYPEAHVWEYYTKIRPFPDTSFKFPVKLDKPCFAMTVTYKKSKFFKRPIMEVFIDGPFFAQGETAKQKTHSLYNLVYDTMQERSKNSNIEYIEYIKAECN